MRLIDADALKELIVSNVYPVADYFNSRDYGLFWTGGIEKAIDDAPSIETIYGYHFNELAFIASILAKEGVAPSELTRIIWDADRITRILCKEIEDNFQKAMNGYMVERKQS